MQQLRGLRNGYEQSWQSMRSAGQAVATGVSQAAEAVTTGLDTAGQAVRDGVSTVRDWLNNP
jgi:hypothetical protein